MSFKGALRFRGWRRPAVPAASEGGDAPATDSAVITSALDEAATATSVDPIDDSVIDRQPDPENPDDVAIVRPRSGRNMAAALTFGVGLLVLALWAAWFHALAFAVLL